MLQAIEPECFCKACWLISNHTGLKKAATDPVYGPGCHLPTFRRKQLLRELHRRLSALQESGSLHHDEAVLCAKLAQHIPPAPTEAEVEQELSELRIAWIARQKDKPLKEDVIVRSASHPPGTQGFDVAFQVRIGDHPAGPQHVAARCNWVGSLMD